MKLGQVPGFMAQRVVEPVQWRTVELNLQAVAAQMIKFELGR